MFDFEKFKEKKIEKKSEKNKKNIKNNKLFLYAFLNSFNLFFSIVLILNNLKLYKFIINFNYI